MPYTLTPDDMPFPEEVDEDGRIKTVSFEDGKTLQTVPVDEAKKTPPAKPQKQESIRIPEEFRQVLKDVESMPEYKSAPAAKKAKVRESFFNTFIADEIEDPKAKETAFAEFMRPIEKQLAVEKKIDEQIAATEPSIMRDVVGKTAKDIGKGFGEFGYGIQKGVQGFYEPFRHATNLVSKATGLEKGGLFDLIHEASAPNETRAPTTVPGKITSAVGEAIPNILGLMAGTKVIPGGLPAVMALHEGLAGGDEGGLKGGLKGAAHGALMGGTLKGAELLPKAAAIPAMGAIFGGDTALQQGGFTEDALVNGIVGLLLGIGAGKKSGKAEKVPSKEINRERYIEPADAKKTIDMPELETPIDREELNLSPAGGLTRKRPDFVLEKDGLRKEGPTRQRRVEEIQKAAEEEGYVLSPAGGLTRKQPDFILDESGVRKNKYEGEPLSRKYQQRAWEEREMEDLPDDSPEWAKEEAPTAEFGSAPKPLNIGKRKVQKPAAWTEPKGPTSIGGEIRKFTNGKGISRTSVTARDGEGIFSELPRDANMVIKNGGIGIDLVEEYLQREGYLQPGENLIESLRQDPNYLGYGKYEGERTSRQRLRPTEKRILEEPEYPPEWDDPEFLAEQERSSAAKADELDMQRGEWESRQVEPGMEAETPEQDWRQSITVKNQRTAPEATAPRGEGAAEQRQYDQWRDRDIEVPPDDSPEWKSEEASWIDRLKRKNEAKKPIAVDDTVYVEDASDSSKRVPVNFRGWNGDKAIVVFKSGFQAAIPREKVFQADISEPQQPSSIKPEPATMEAVKPEPTPKKETTQAKDSQDLISKTLNDMRNEEPKNQPTPFELIEMDGNELRKKYPEFYEYHEKKEAEAKAAEDKKFSGTKKEIESAITFYEKKLDDLIRQRDDWSSRVYKKNRGKVQVKTNDFLDDPEYRIDSINENRRKKVIQGLERDYREASHKLNALKNALDKKSYQDTTRGYDNPLWSDEYKDYVSVDRMDDAKPSDMPKPKTWIDKLKYPLGNESGQIVLDFTGKKKKYKEEIKKYKALSKINDMIGEEPKAESDLWGTFQTKWIDRFDALSRVPGEKLNRIDKWGLPEREAHKEAWRYASYKDVTALILEDLSKKIPNSVKRQSFLFSNYIAAHRNITRADLGFKNPNKATEADSKQAIIDAEKEFVRKGGKLKDLKKGFEEFQEFTRKHILDPAEEAGIISKAVADSIRKNHEYYATFSVLDYQPKDIDSIPQLRSKEYFSAANQDIIKKLKGTNKKIRDPLAATIDKFIRLRELIARNKVASALVEDKGFTRTLRPIAESQKEFAELKADGKNPVMFDDGILKTNDFDIVSRFKDGNVERYMVDADIGAAMKQLPSHSINRLVSGANAVFRATTTTMYLPFSISNIGRDFIQGYTTSPTYKKNPIDFGIYIGDVAKGTAKGLAHEFFRKSKTVRQYLEDGGGFGFVGSVRNGAELVAELRKTGIVHYFDSAQDFARLPVDLAKLPFKAVEKFSAGIELGPRIANKERSLKRGAPNREAALIARNSTVDFNKAGEHARVFNQWTPFINARIQGRNNLIRAVRRDIDKGEYSNTAGKIAMTVLIPGLATYFANRLYHSDLYDDIDQRTRDNYFTWILGKAKDKNGKTAPHFVIFPKGDIGQMVMNPITYALDQFYSDNPKEFKRFATGFLSDLSPIPFANDKGELSAERTIGALAPPPFKALGEPAFNRDTWRQRDIEPSWMEKMRPEKRKFDSTPKEYVEAGERLGISPLKIQNVMGNIFGSMGRHGISGFNNAMKGRFHRISGGEIERNAWENIDSLDQDYNYIRSDAIEASENGDRKKAKNLMIKWNKTVDERIEEFNSHFKKYGIEDRGGLKGKYKFSYEKMMNVMKSGQGEKISPLEKKLRR